MDWDKLRIFHAVAEAGSFTHAGEKLNLSQSAVSRQISALEENLRVSLFHRHARGLILTEQGETLNRTVREMFSKLSLTQAFLSESKSKAAGQIKITTTTGFGLCWLTPRLHRFLELHPDIEVTLLVEDDELDLGMREADVAIRMHPPKQPDLIQRHLTNFPMPIYSSRAYLEEHGTPNDLASLARHQLIGFSGWHPPLPNVNWLVELASQTLHTTLRNRIEINNLPAVASAIASGVGIGSLPLYIANSYPNLVQIMKDQPLPIVEAYFVYPEELRTSKRISVFRDFLLAEISNDQKT
ncbi:LysR family transcriptional regulator [Neoasaia chiangmaiensis NBRC 101099]|uniref:LysR family transcriptional regulator n=1 Tax=Neoasaia chiangmaiensis TaxID=320497 RepID=A0A1U9KND5_9PROT|nr:LysR family transcriptional regulator [Neoasaia chiangmaiensis]AQS87295.1 LysR family transcriptional regulator [Neoasaia chiangmaiensis]GBR38598.1 LysR family transcriptional regulator [Neoasaia chiangmaiensis NBRC 101099]GEN15828.1 LysR family transcriptional regulator [Neoasaia chiangmaiensis]